jgi:predicted nuclease with RNAse H fold
MSTVAGIDLASAPEYGAARYNRVGLAALSEDLEATAVAGRLPDDAIFDFVAGRGCALVAIDSPLSLPAGRCCGSQTCSCAQHGIVRQVDREMARLHYHPYWPLMPSMRPLTLRGIALKQRFEAAGIEVIEVFPGAAQDSLGIPRKQRGLPALRDGLRLLGIQGDLPPADGDALDAVTAAYVAWLYRRGKTIALGPPDEVQVHLPRARDLTAAFG